MRIMRYIYLLSIVVNLISCSSKQEIRRFTSPDNSFSVNLPSSYCKIKKEKLSTYFISDSSGKEKIVKITSIRDNDTCRMDFMNDKCPWKDIFSSDKDIVKRNYFYSFRKKIGRTYYIFETNARFSKQEIISIYNSIIQLYTYSSNQDNRRAIGPIMFGSNYSEFLKQKKEFLDNYQTLYEYPISDVIPTFVNGKVAAVKIYGKRKKIDDCPALTVTQWAKLYGDSDKFTTIYSNLFSEGVFVDEYRTVIVSYWGGLLEKRAYDRNRKLTYYVPSIYIEDSYIMDAAREALLQAESEKLRKERDRGKDVI